MTRRHLAALGISIFLFTACSPDAIGPREFESPSDIGPPLPVSGDAGDPGDALAIESDLTILMGEIVPNDNSTLGKFKNIQDLYNSGDVQGAIEATGNLISFITNKYDQYLDPPKPGHEDTCLEYNGVAGEQCAPTPYKGEAWTPGNDIYVDQLFTLTKTNLWAWVGLGGNVCEVPSANPGTFCQTTDDSAFVYFPPSIFQNLTFVSVEKNPPGLTKLQDTFDEYPNYVRILTAPFADFSDDVLYPVKPLVVVCFNQTVLQNPTSLLARLLLGTNHTDPNTGITEFKLLPKPDFSSYDAEALAQAQAICGAPPAPSAPAFSNGTVIGRLANKVLDALLPRSVQAQYRYDEMAFGGVGGSAEEFSDFGGIDPGMDFGGVGGSAEEFSPPALAPGAQALPTDNPPAGSIVGPASSADNSTGAPWATVTVKTDLNVPIMGAEVTFALLDPVTYSDTSQAAFCGGAAAVVDTTDVNGEVTLDCLNFGTLAGFKNLKATVNPATVNTLACVIIPSGTDAGLCATDPSTVGVNFLVVTQPATAAKLSVTNTPLSPSAGAVLSPAPTVQVLDAFDNPVGGVRTVTASLAPDTSLAGTTSESTNSDGLATFDDLKLGGVVGTTYTITFASTGLTGATVNVTITAAGAAAGITYDPAVHGPASTAPNGVYGSFNPFTAVSPNPTVIGTDAWGNVTSGGGAVSWSLSPTDILSGATVTNPVNSYSAQWKLGDGGGVLQTLTASLGASSVNFTATDVAGGISLACVPSSPTKKSDIGNAVPIDATMSTYTAYFSMSPELAARMRSVTLYASVTGQSSSLETYDATLTAYRGGASPTTLGPLLSTSEAGSGLTLPGDNGNPTAVTFDMTPAAIAVASPGNTNKVIFKLVVTAASNRTVTLWYNSKANSGICGSSIIYAPGVTDFNSNSNKDISKGLQITVTN